MKKYPVNKRVNSAKNDDPQCAQEITLADAEALLGLFMGIGAQHMNPVLKLLQYLVSANLHA